MKNKLISALVLNFSLSWGLALITYLVGLRFTGSNVAIIGIVYMFMPALSVAILSKFFWHIPLKQWGVKKPQNRWVFIACLLPLFLALLTFLLSFFIPGIKFEPGMDGIISRFATDSQSIAAMKNQITTLGSFLPFIIIAQSIVGGLTINSLVAFGEEYFWRGFFLQQLEKISWLKASIIIGFVWGLWHAPLILQGHNYPQHPIAGVFMMILWCILLSFSMVYFVRKTHSVFTAALFHGLLNGTAGLPLIWTSNGNDLIIGVTGLVGCLSLLILNFLLYLYDHQNQRVST